MHPQQHKYNNDDYYHNYNPNYSLHWFVPFLSGVFAHVFRYGIPEG